jgi:hypothetical protein
VVVGEDKGVGLWWDCLLGSFINKRDVCMI